MSKNDKKLSDTCVQDINNVVELVAGSITQSSLLEIDSSEPLPHGAGLLEVISREMRFLRQSSTQPSLIIPNLIATLGFATSHPYNKAAYALSVAIEDKQDNQPSYHNDRHAIEVAVAAYILGKREKLPNDRVAELVIAATSHDLGHQGANNSHAFEWEQRAFKLAEPFLKSSGVSPGGISHIRAMILATDFKDGVPKAKADYRQHRLLNADDARRMSATQNLLICEADVFFSCFDLSYNQLLSRLLSIEWNRPNKQNLPASERMGFLSYVEFISTAAVELGLEERRKFILESLRFQEAA